LLACFDRCRNNLCAEIIAFKTETEAFFNTYAFFSGTAVLHLFDMLPPRLFVIKKIANV